jgi:hypothetical protein
MLWPTGPTEALPEDPPPQLTAVEKQNAASAAGINCLRLRDKITRHVDAIMSSVTEPCGKPLSLFPKFAKADNVFPTVRTAPPEALIDPGIEHVVLPSELETLQLKLTLPLKFANRVT